MLYNPAAWYWTCPTVTGQVWSSAQMAWISATDATYLNWASMANTATVIDTTANLASVMAEQVAPIVLTKGITLTSTATPALNGTYPLDQLSQSRIVALAAGLANGKGFPGGGSAILWNGASFSSENFLNFAAAAEAYVYGYEQAVAGLAMQMVGVTLPSSSITIP